MTKSKLFKSIYIDTIEMIKNHDVDDYVIYEYVRYLCDDYDIANEFMISNYGGYTESELLSLRIKLANEINNRLQVN